ncbi:alcohol dehydrogenase catalytic domain-containing protein [Micromonospora sp. NPDC048935]|uniref:alcohol dehydrogenase catalytic domain-containing protein n=1 Tax=Micromonospora sp. NPDC048935 TaxID=3364262 RepID=UPI0037149EF6
MKRLQYDRYGGPEVMWLAEFEPARPGRDEVLVRVRVAASNALDWKMRNGEMKLMTGRFPGAMGHDFAGVVEAVGVGVTRLKAGDAVLGGARFRQAGAFAEMVTAPEKAVVLKPVDLSYEQAAALPTVGVPAYQATAEVRPGAGGIARALIPRSYSVPLHRRPAAGLPDTPLKLERNPRTDQSSSSRTRRRQSRMPEQIFTGCRHVTIAAGRDLLKHVKHRGTATVSGRPRTTGSLRMKPDVLWRGHTADLALATSR